MKKKNKSSNRSSTQNRKRSSSPSNKKFSKNYHRPDPHPNTNRYAWDRAFEEGKGKGKKEMSRLYDKYNAENDDFGIKTARRRKSPFSSTTVQHSRASKPAAKTIKYTQKRLILDDLREYRSSKIISSVSNSFAEFIVKTTAKTLDNSQKNVLRSVIALATSEALNKAFEKELSTLDKIKTFVKIGEMIYKVFLWYDEKTQGYRTDEYNIHITKESSLEYKWFLMRHRTLRKIYSNKVCLTLEDFKSGKTCPLRKRLDKKNIIPSSVIPNTPNSCPYYYCCNTII